jgi:hypothetical protein
MLHLKHISVRGAPFLLYPYFNYPAKRATGHGWRLNNHNYEAHNYSW